MGILSEMDMMNRDAEDDAFEVSSDSETVDSFSEEFESVEPQKPDQQAEDEEARKKAEFDVAEAKRKAEWETKQAQKKLREQQELDRLAAMSDDDVMQASMNRVSQDTERLTRRNMKLCVMEDVQTECLADPAFARLVMNPKKKMLNCFHYINRKAREYLEQEMKDNDEKPMGGGFGGDVPDELGDVLFAAVKVGRFCGCDPEDAVNGTCEKFIHRFRAVEEGAAVRGREVSQLSLEEMTALWNEAKRS